MKHKILRILPYATTALIMALIFFFSSQTSEESSALSAGLTRRLIDFFMFGATQAQKENCLEAIHWFIRKCAHFTLFAALGFSASGMFVGKKRLHIWIYSVVLCMVYALTDEMHQMMIEGRAPMIRDVLIDTAGGAFGAAVFILILIIYVIRKDKRHD